MRGMLILSAAAGLALLAAPAAPAAATFPGTNGLLVFERELPAVDHTQADLYTIGPNASGLTRLTNTPGLNEFGPAWNRAGTRIALWRTPAPFGPGSIWVMDANGQHPHRLTSGFDARDPAWNPAGNRLVFTRISGTNFDLWTMRASDGLDRHQLTSGPAEDFEAAWSPDGTTIAFTRGSEQGDPGDIYLKDLRTGAIRRVTHSADYDHQVDWAPGGRHLVFERDYRASSSIFTVALDGSHLVRLTSGPYFDVGPVFSPDRTKIIFGTDRGSGGLDDLWVMNSDGSHLRLFRHLVYSEGFPDWQPR